MELRGVILSSMRSLLLMPLTGVFILLLQAVAPAGNPVEEPEGGPGITTGQNIRVEGLHYTEWKGGKVLWELLSPGADYYHVEHLARLEDVEVTLHSDGNSKMRLEADTVSYDTETGILTAEGNVRGESDQGYKFLTASLVYDIDSREVNTLDKVTIRKDRLFIEGLGMKGSLRDNNFALYSEVRAEFAPEVSTRQEGK